MGFGTLFVGYFFVLNLFYPALTDTIAALIMLLAFYKLRDVNRGFRWAIAASSVMAVLGTAELVLKLGDMLFAMVAPSELTTALAVIRHFTVALVTFTMMSGIKDVASEVELPLLVTKAKSASYATLPVYALSIFLEAAAPSFIPTEVMATLATATLLATAVLAIFNLTVIYSAYMHICMPEELANDVAEKESRFGFVNAFRRHQEEKSREYAEYKLERRREKAEKRKRKKK